MSDFRGKFWSPKLDDKIVAALLLLKRRCCIFKQQATKSQWLWFKLKSQYFWTKYLRESKASKYFGHSHCLQVFQGLHPMVMKIFYWGHHILCKGWNYQDIGHTFLWSRSQIMMRGMGNAGAGGVYKYSIFLCQEVKVKIMTHGFCVCFNISLSLILKKTINKCIIWSWKLIYKNKLSNQAS